MKDQIKGKAEELKGKVTGDKSEEMKGKAHQAEGDAKRTARDMRGDVREAMDRNLRDRGDDPNREPGPDDV